MHYYILHSDSKRWDKYFKSIVRFSHLFIRGLIKGLSPNHAISSICSVEIHYYIVQSDSKQWEEYFKSIFEIFTPTN